jgi:hypothetical protein
MTTTSDGMWMVVYTVLIAMTVASSLYLPA